MQFVPTWKFEARFLGLPLKLVLGAIAVTAPLALVLLRKLNETQKSQPKIIQREEHLRQIELHGQFDWKIDHFDKISKQTNFAKLSSKHNFYFPEVKKSYKCHLELTTDQSDFILISAHFQALQSGEAVVSCKICIVGACGKFFETQRAHKCLPPYGNNTNFKMISANPDRLRKYYFGPLNSLHIRSSFTILDSLVSQNFLTPQEVIL